MLAMENGTVRCFDVIWLHAIIANNVAMAAVSHELSIRHKSRK